MSTRLIWSSPAQVCLERSGAIPIGLPYRSRISFRRSCFRKTTPVFHERDSSAHGTHHEVGFSGHSLERSGENATDLDLYYPPGREPAMRRSTVRFQGSWELRSLFVCFALLAATSFEIRGLVKDLRAVSSRNLSVFHLAARSKGASDQSSSLEEPTSRNHDESGDAWHNRSLLQALDVPHQSSAPSIRAVYPCVAHSCASWNQPMMSWVVTFSSASPRAS